MSFGLCQRLESVHIPVFCDFAQLIDTFAEAEMLGFYSLSSKYRFPMKGFSFIFKVIR